MDKTKKELRNMLTTTDEIKDRLKNMIRQLEEVEHEIRSLISTTIRLGDTLTLQ